MTGNVAAPEPPAVGRVLIISGSVGAGHDGAARELAIRLRRSGVQVEVRDFLSAVPAWVAWVLREGYLATSRFAPAGFDAMFASVEKQGAGLRSFQRLARLGSPALAAWISGDRFDAVVSTYPVSSQCLGDMRRRGACTIPAVTYITDPAVHHAWVHPAVDHHLTVTALSAEQGRRVHGVDMVATGPLVSSQFATIDERSVAEVRRELSLTERGPIALLSAGSLGLGDIPGAAADVSRAGFVPLVLCGRNDRLRRRLARVRGAVALGWRTDVHVLMGVADVLVHNAGGLSFTEALVSGLPAVTYRPIPGHGRANAAVLDLGGFAPWARDANQLAQLMWEQQHRGRRPLSGGDPAEAMLAILPRAKANPA